MKNTIVSFSLIVLCVTLSSTCGAWSWSLSAGKTPEEQALRREEVSKRREEIAKRRAEIAERRSNDKTKTSNLENQTVKNSYTNPWNLFMDWIQGANKRAKNTLSVDITKKS